MGKNDELYELFHRFQQLEASVRCMKSFVQNTDMRLAEDDLVKFASLANETINEAISLKEDTIKHYSS